MKFSDINDKYFGYLIQHAQSLKETCDDLRGFHGIIADSELASIFPSELELKNMRTNDIDLIDKQWYDFWEIIERHEINLARSRILLTKFEAECRRLNLEHPVKYDKDGYAYREFVDWDGTPYFDYLEMGG
jgi:hypothetical protein